ncbi:MAG: serine/threonine protein kinase [Lachnospiraceae bacterium]|nr:serine/threonine protein kinase [Lachnospiraceae bacterium]
MAGKEYSLPENSGYRMIRRLGSGGEGTVYLVCHMNTEQLRAAKVLTNIRENKRHELDMLKNLNHPSLPKVIDILEEGEDTWLIMEYVQGCRLDQAVSRGLGQKQFWSVARQLSEVLVYLHNRKKPVLHLDIKPSNILLRPDEGLVLIDFGSSIRGHPDEHVNSGYGTPGFAAPEQQVEGARVDARTDLFGAGAVLYYCRYGKTPDPDRKWRRRTGLDRILAKCLEKEPDRRYADSLEFYRAICRGIRTEKRRRMLRGSFGAVTLLVLSASLLLSDLQSRQITSLFLSVKSSAESDEGEGLGTVFGEDQETGTLLEKGQESEPFFEKTGESETYFEEEGGETKTVTEEDVQTYNRLLAMASGLGFTQAIECYLEASALFPGDSEWYLNLLDQVTADGLFDEIEEQAVKELIYAVQPDTGATALELLKENEEAYGEVAYRFGLAYWYFYEGSGGKSAAAWWFQCALETLDGDSTAVWQATAVILARVGSYYGALGNAGTDEEISGKEWDYWNDLKGLWKLFCSQGEDQAICAETAEELLSLLTLHAYDLGQNGETGEEMLEIVSDIERYLSDDSLGLEDEKTEKMIAMAQTARAAVERAFQN